jgi:hypothetical protein
MQITGAISRACASCQISRVNDDTSTKPTYRAVSSKRQALFFHRLRVHRRRNGLSIEQTDVCRRELRGYK